MADRMEELTLEGIDGSNPLAFLAVVGMFRVLSESIPTARLRWVRDSQWSPRLLGVASPSDLLDLLVDRLNSSRPESDPAFGLRFDGEEVADKLTQGIHSYRKYAAEAARRSRPADRRAADFALAWRSDGAPDGEYERGRRGRTDFDFTAGNQKLLTMVRDVASATGRDELERTLFRFWDYADQGTSLRWDPLDETRQYAVQFHDPAGSRNPIRTMTGANRLAVEALPWLPVLPTSRGLRTVGFESSGRVERLIWPIWSPATSAGTVRSLLALADLHAERPDSKALRRRGIEQVFESRVVLPSGRYRCFTPARLAVRGTTDTT